MTTAVSMSTREPFVPVASGAPPISLTHVMFVLWGLLGGILVAMVMLTAPLYFALYVGIPTIFIGGLLFFGFAAILSYRGKSW